MKLLEQHLNLQVLASVNYYLTLFMLWLSNRMLQSALVSVCIWKDPVLFLTQTTPVIKFFMVLFIVSKKVAEYYLEIRYD